MTTTYPKGGTNKMWEPMHIAMNAKVYEKLSAITIQGRTCGRDGSKITIFEKCGEKQESLAEFRYDYHQFGPGYFPKMAKDAAEKINFWLEISGYEPFLQATEFYGMMKELLDKCESRYGNRLPDSDYEVLVTFAD